MTKPTLDEVKQYGAEISLSTFECDKFYDYFSANGWKVGRNPMKDWKAALRNWKRNTGGYANRQSRPQVRADGGW